MKPKFKELAFIAASILLLGCEESGGDLNEKTAQQQKEFNELYKGMDQPTDRTKGKGY